MYKCLPSEYQAIRYDTFLHDERPALSRGISQRRLILGVPASLSFEIRGSPRYDLSNGVGGSKQKISEATIS